VKVPLQHLNVKIASLMFLLFDASCVRHSWLV
jgi:hypothetical protein